MRTSQEPNFRRREILDAALDLFSTLGYENTSINDIIKKVGVTKGSFYHHFASKDDIVELIAVEQANELIAAFTKSVQQLEGNIVKKINRLFFEMHAYRAQSEQKRFKLFDILWQSNNGKLRQKLVEHYFTLSKPILISLIHEGNKEGVIDISYPEEMAEFCLHFSLLMNSSLNSIKMSLKDNSDIINVIERKRKFYSETLERILGLQKGSLTFNSNVKNHAENASDIHVAE